jgi:putative SOS response-associated peptidase YedK
LGADAGTLVAQFDLFEAPAWRPRYNIAPTQPAPTIVIASADPRREFTLLRWGLIPSWAKDPAIGSRMINAQAETAATKPAFRSAFRKRRCFVLADGFYEWGQQGRTRQPYYIRLRDGRPFAIAGLWERWEGASGTPITSCTLLTIAANDLIGAFHHRMPVILDPEHYDLWLDPSVRDPERLQPLLRPYPADAMSAYPVSTRVNNPAHDSPDCIAPLP